MTFIVYSKKNCPFCDKAKQLLELTEQKHVIYTLDEDFTKEEFCAEFGANSTFPRIVKDTELIGGTHDLVRIFQEQKII